MKILIYGAGVLGCELASTLCRRKDHVTLLARGSWKDTIDQRGLTVRHTLQFHTTCDHLTTIDHLEPHWVFDLIFVVLQAGQLPAALPELGRNLSRHVVFVGNNAYPEETCQQLRSLSSTEKEIAFGFLSAAGHREGTRVICVHKGVHLTIGGLGKPLSLRLQKLLKKAARGTALRYQFEPDMSAWLKCHLALILPLSYAVYAHRGHMEQITPEQRRTCLDAALEGCTLLRSLGCSLPQKDSEDWFRRGWKRKLMELMMLLLVKTPLGPLCAGHHAMNAMEEIRYLDRGFSELRAKGGQSMPAWEQLRQESLHLLCPIHLHHG